MKKIVLIGIIGCGVFIGTAIYVLIKYINKDITNGSNEEPLKEDSLIFLSEKDVESEIANLDETKIQSANSIYNRHIEAAEIVREAMENINDNSEVLSEHKKEFDNMLDELNMLSE